MRFLTEKDMEGSEHKLKYMSKFDTLVEVCMVAAKLYEEDENLQQPKKESSSFVFDKSWGKRHVRSDRGKITLLRMSSRTCGISGEELFKAYSSSRDYKNALGKKRKYCDYEDFEYYGKKEKVAVGKKITCSRSKDEDFEYSVKKEKKLRNNGRVRNRVVETAPLPVEFADEIRRLGGNDVRLLIQKTITATDLKPNQNRFSIPVNQLREEARDFLTEAEKKTLEQRYADNGIVPIRVQVLEPNLKRSYIDFKKWPVNSSFWYILCGSWTVVQTTNDLQANTDIQVWSFRVNGDLNLALVKVPCS